MKRIALMLAFAMAVGALALPVAASSHYGDEDKDRNWRLHGEVRGRYENLENFTDAQDDMLMGGSIEYKDNLGFWPYRVRMGAMGEFTDDVYANIEFQAHGVFGERGTPFVSPGDPIEQSFGGSSSSSDSDVQLYQGYVKLKNIGGSNASLKIGRAEHTLGNELQMGDLDFYNGITFDGARVYFDWDRVDLDVFYYNNEEMDNVAGMPPSLIVDGIDDDVTFAGVTADIPVSKGEIQPYLLHYRGGGFTGSFDTPSIGMADLKWDFFTFGGLWRREVNSIDDAEESPFDWSIEVATQSGDIDADTNSDGAVDEMWDAAGTIFEGWFGYNWTNDDTRHRVHVGGFMASGDDDPNDTDVDDYIPLFPDNHSYNRLGDLDLFAASWSKALGSNSTINVGNTGFSNITDYNVGYSLYSGNHHFMAALHQLSLTEEVDISGQKEDDIGLELDLKYGYHYSKNLSFEVGVAQLSAGDLLDKTLTSGSADDIRRIYTQARLRY